MKDAHPVVYTIGHSNHTLAKFIALLQGQQINVLVDVRSAPYSKYVSHFNKDALKEAVEGAGMSYVYMGNVLGGRWLDPELCFSDGTVDYGLVAQTDEFRKGLQTLIKNIRNGARAALMCCEKDPYDCHRFALDARFLQEEGVAVRHILEDGRVIENSDLEARLLADYPTAIDLFSATPDKGQALVWAYEDRNRDIAYVLDLGSQSRS